MNRKEIVELAARAFAERPLPWRKQSVLFLANGKDMIEYPTVTYGEEDESEHSDLFENVTDAFCELVVAIPELIQLLKEIEDRDEQKT